MDNTRAILMQMQAMHDSMNELRREVQNLKNENEELRKENAEIKLNVVSMNPVYSNEERAMAAQQLMEIQARKQARQALEERFDLGKL